ncbi:MBL fold metallo-hydrolase [Streptomyces sp. NPDC005573]|uniref:MBL fold metallo-hydrolase n=1 Tax=Streptomyces sp. NPDC005573 TaxID=3156890 RepID=UPI0033B7CF7B
MTAPPVADGWYELHEVGDGVARITEPHADKLLRANVWWLRGAGRDIVVDAGLGVASLREWLPAMFERDPLVLLTHAHLDHAGGAHEFRERAAHPAAAHALARGVAASLHGPELARLLGIDASEDPLPPLLIDALPHPGYDPRAYTVAPLTVTRTLLDGDVVTCGGRSLTVVHLPGHTPGCVTFHEADTGTLYTGDVIYNGDLVDDLPESDPAAYRRSLTRLSTLDVSVVHPGHGRPFGRERLDGLLDRHLRRTAPGEEAARSMRA